MTHALLFPGQGSQEVGMGQALHDSFAEAKEVFQEVDDVLEQRLSTLMFTGPLEELTLTENAQPAIMAVSIAALRVLQKQTGFDVSQATFLAGHSLGEYAAYCAAGSFSLADTTRLLRTRGNAMQAAVPEGEGAMAALIGVDLPTAENIAEQAAEGDVCQVANDNAPGQVVISGSKEAVARAEALAKEAGAKRFLLLNVSAPFHSSLMGPAAEVMEAALSEVEIGAPVVPVVANVTATAVSTAEDISGLLVQQVTGRVRWRESLEFLHSKQVNHTIEIGAGKVLSGLTKRTQRDMMTSAVGTPEDVDAFAAALAA